MHNLVTKVTPVSILSNILIQSVLIIRYAFKQNYEIMWEFSPNYHSEISTTIKFHGGLISDLQLGVIRFRK